MMELFVVYVCCVDYDMILLRREYAMAILPVACCMPFIFVSFAYSHRCFECANFLW